MIELRDLTLQVADKLLLENANLRLEKHYRVGLVGRNGCGKTSLLKFILTTTAQPNRNVICAVPQQHIGYLEQHLPNSELTAIEYVKTGDWRWINLQAELADAEKDDDGNKIALCFERMQAIDGYTIDARAAKILNGLGFSEQQFTQSVKIFSGGWQMRLQLAKVLLSQAHVLLLDEPTNHLDIEAIIWLSSWLKQQKATQLIISHDRDFLDEVCTHTAHLAHQSLKLYTGNYSQFQQQYAAARLLDERTRKKTAAQRTHMESFINRFRAKASKAKQVQSRVKALEKLEYSMMTHDEAIYEFNFTLKSPVTGPIITLRGDVGYPHRILLPSLSFSLYAEERIGIVGPNGIGKTTLLNTLANCHALVNGDVLHHNNLKIGYYAQNQADQFAADATPLTILRDLDAALNEKQARAMLGKIGFSGARVTAPMKTFSGGERSRLALTLLSHQKPQLLILDEPTNHLDLESKEALIVALLKFEGTIVTVSHDRYFMSSVVNQIYYINNKKLQRLEQNDWHNFENKVIKSKNLPSKKAASKNKRDKTRDEKAKNIEVEIGRANEALKLLENKLIELNSQGVLPSAEEYQVITSRYKQLKSKIKNLEIQWMELSDEKL